MSEQQVPNLQWVRASDGVIAGICKGLCDSFGFPTWILRLALIVLFLWFGFGLFLYVLCWIAFPREDRIPQALRAKILGVCYKFSQKFDCEVGLVRFIALLLFLTSAGVVTLAYLIAALVLGNEKPSGTRAERHKSFYS